MCKADYVAQVKRMMPLFPRHTAFKYYQKGVLSIHSGAMTIDIQHIEAYLDLRAIEAAHGEGKKAGSEERSTGARPRAQSQSRSRPRRLVRRQSILRCQGPGPGALRDGATPPSGRDRNQRGCRNVRRHPADLLQ